MSRGLRFFREAFLRIYSSSPVYKSIKKTFHYYFKKFFLHKCHYLKAYEDQIIILSVFLMLSSSFLRKRKKEKYFDFEWQSYFSFFMRRNMNGFILCALRYLLDSGTIKIKENLLEECFQDLKGSFLQQYIHSLVYGKSKDFNVNINLSKYQELLDLVLKINHVYRKQIPVDSSRVLDLVDYTHQWKKKMFKLFDHRAEYIVFSFFVNLKR